jgi:NitT/TauT family transport system substrate-binding protein
MGWLKKINIRLIRTVSLGESLDLYKNSLIEGLAATNYEYEKIKNKVSPVVLLDKSYGGDKIMSNFPLQKLLNASKIDVYLEIDSVNSVLLESFIKKYHISKKKLIYHNYDQQEIIRNSYNLSKPVLIVTYAPYDSTLKKMGFKEIVSTKTDSDLLIIDAVFIDKNFIDDRFRKFKKYIDIAINEIKKHPKKVYQKIKNYYTNYSYDDFKADLKNIQWINKPSRKFINKLEEIGIETKDLINEN